MALVCAIRTSRRLRGIGRSAAARARRTVKVRGSWEHCGARTWCGMVWCHQVMPHKGLCARFECAYHAHARRHRSDRHQHHHDLTQPSIIGVRQRSTPFS